MNKESDRNAAYNYYPEDQENFGTIIINKTMGEIETNLSSNDKFGRYIMHAVKRVIEYFEEGVYKKQDFVVWY